MVISCPWLQHLLSYYSYSSSSRRWFWLRFQGNQPRYSLTSAHSHRLEAVPLRRIIQTYSGYILKILNFEFAISSLIPLVSDVISRQGSSETSSAFSSSPTSFVSSLRLISPLSRDTDHSLTISKQCPLVYFWWSILCGWWQFMKISATWNCLAVKHAGRCSVLLHPWSTWFLLCHGLWKDCCRTSCQTFSLCE